MAVILGGKTAILESADDSRMNLVADVQRKWKIDRYLSDGFPLVLLLRRNNTHNVYYVN